jgi:hypothetical protein
LTEPHEDQAGDELVEGGEAAALHRVAPK